MSKEFAGAERDRNIGRPCCYSWYGIGVRGEDGRDYGRDTRDDGWRDNVVHPYGAFGRSALLGKGWIAVQKYFDYR